MSGGGFRSFVVTGQRFLSIDGCNTAVLEVVVALVQRVPHLGQFGQTPRHSILDEFVRLTACSGGKLLKLGFSFRFQAYNHTCGLERLQGTVKAIVG
jgi:hypothetical protein